MALQELFLCLSAKHKKLVCILFCLLLTTPVYSQKEPTIIAGTVVDAFTHDLIEGEVEVSLLTLDSTVVQTTKCRIITDQDRERNARIGKWKYPSRTVMISYLDIPVRSI